MNKEIIYRTQSGEYINNLDFERNDPVVETHLVFDEIELPITDFLMYK